MAKYNFTNAFVIDYPNSAPVKADEAGTPLSILTCCAMAMFRPTQADAQLELPAKVKKFKLGNKLNMADTASILDRIVELDSDEVTLIKNCCNQLYGTLVVGQVCEFFESASTHPTKLESVKK